MSFPFVIQRILKAIERPSGRPYDEPTGPIYLDAADTDWLRDHLLTIATSTDTSKGHQHNHWIWVSVDVALRRLADPGKPYKVAYADVAEFWKVQPRNIEDWERSVRDVAASLVESINVKVLVSLVKRNRDNYVKSQDK